MSDQTIFIVEKSHKRTLSETMLNDLSTNLKIEVGQCNTDFKIVSVKRRDIEVDISLIFKLDYLPPNSSNYMTIFLSCDIVVEDNELIVGNNPPHKALVIYLKETYKESVERLFLELNREYKKIFKLDLEGNFSVSIKEANEIVTNTLVNYYS